jgi:SAM-dependent methyltransferase
MRSGSSGRTTPPPTTTLPGTSPAVVAAWTSAMANLLGPTPARVLDCGAGTGFLSLVAARLGHVVTALDISGNMLERLARTAGGEHLDVSVVEAPAAEPPPGPFDVVMERHLLWTLPDPATALRAWLTVAPAGRLVLVESLWGRADLVETLRGSARRLLRRVRGDPPDHHASYTPVMRAALPLGTGPAPRSFVQLARETGWENVRLERLRDVEWAMRSELGPIERAIGVSPRFAVVADHPTSRVAPASGTRRRSRARSATKDGQ